MLASFVLADRADQDLLTSIKRLVATEFDTNAHIVAHLAEIDVRRLYRGEGCSSLFRYCTEVLHLSEAASYRRIDVARLARRFPLIFEKLAEGSVNLTTAQILGPCLTEENHRSLLEATAHKSRIEVEKIVVAVRPRPEAPSVVRKLPAATVNGEAREESGREGLFADRDPGPVAETAPKREHSATSTDVSVRTAPVRKPVVSPLAPELYKIQFTADAETHRMLRQLQELLRHQVPNGDPGVIFKKALRMLLDRVAREKLAQVKRPRRRASERTTETERTKTEAVAGNDDRENSRHIPAAVKRAVWERDGGRCGFVSGNGRQCSERGHLEFHHVKPYAWGGKATLDNVTLRCRAHNAHEGELVFGRRPLMRRDAAGAGRGAASTKEAVPTLSGESQGVTQGSALTLDI